MLTVRATSRSATCVLSPTNDNPDLTVKHIILCRVWLTWAIPYIDFFDKKTGWI